MNMFRADKRIANRWTARAFGGVLSAGLTGLFFVLISIAFLDPANAQLTRSVDIGDHGFETKVARLAVTPMAVGADPFRYRLKWLSHEMSTGNAATIYNRAFTDYSFFKTDRVNWKEFKDDYSQWSGGSITLADIPLDKLKAASSRFSSFIDDRIAAASPCRQCDWGYSIRDLSGEKWLDLEVPDIRSTNSISWVLTLQTRVAILERRFEDAVRLLRMHYTLAQHVAKFEYNIATLTAVAHLSRANKTLMELVAAAEAPNMYWAIAQLPHPIISGVGAMEMQARAFDTIVPEFAAVKTLDLSTEQWKTLALKITRVLVTADGYSMDAVEKSPAELDAEANAMLVAASLKGLAAAKKRLLDGGVTQDQLAAMSVSQIMVVDAREEYESARSEQQKSFYLPIPAAIKYARDSRDNYDLQAFQVNLGRRMFNMFGPIDLQIRIAEIQSQLDLIQTIEALRLHAAATSTFPLALDEITSVPIPVNPLTEEPFQCQLSPDSAEFNLGESMYGSGARVIVTIKKTNSKNQPRGTDE